MFQKHERNISIAQKKMFQRGERKEQRRKREILKVG